MRSGSMTKTGSDVLKWAGPVNSLVSCEIPTLGEALTTHQTYVGPRVTPLFWRAPQALFWYISPRCKCCWHAHGHKTTVGRRRFENALPSRHLTTNPHTHWAWFRAKPVRRSVRLSFSLEGSGGSRNRNRTVQPKLWKGRLVEAETKTSVGPYAR
jgi:hypothetical protein